MGSTKLTKKQDAADRSRVSRLYARASEGIPVSILSLSKIMDAGLAALRAGGDDEAVSQAIRSAVKASVAA